YARDPGGLPTDRRDVAQRPEVPCLPRRQLDPTARVLPPGVREYAGSLRQSATARGPNTQPGTGDSQLRRLPEAVRFPGLNSIGKGLLCRKPHQTARIRRLRTTTNSMSSRPWLPQARAWTSARRRLLIIEKPVSICQP